MKYIYTHDWEDKPYHVPYEFEFDIGERVFHKVHGEGVVADVDEKYVYVSFDDGMKPAEVYMNGRRNVIRQEEIGGFFPFSLAKV